jgi:hypothetical protein
MSTPKVDKPSDPGMQVLEVAGPIIASFSAFGNEMAQPAMRERMRRAREDWQVTDHMSVQSYSCTNNTVQIVFESVILEIMADSPTVTWRLRDTCVPLAKSKGPSILIHTDRGDKRQVFDRDAVLKRIIGERIRYAPSTNELYLVWKPNHEIGFYSLQLKKQDSWLLYFEYNLPMENQAEAVGREAPKGPW